MPKTHPHAAATYRIVSLEDGAFGVEVDIPDTPPTVVSRFASEAEGEAWAAEHRRRVQLQAQSGGWFRVARNRRG
jgi:hypothetical protein